jgi:hypothetical protein
MKVGHYLPRMVLLDEIAGQSRWLLPARSGAHGLVVLLNDEVRLIGHGCYSKDKHARYSSCKCAAIALKPNGDEVFLFMMQVA